MKTKNLLHPELPANNKKTLYWGGLYGSAELLAISEAVQQHDGLSLVITPDMHKAQMLEEALGFFAPDTPRYPLPDWETLPYDVFSPHQDIISQRLLTLYQLPQARQGVLIVPATTLMQRLPERRFVEGNVLHLQVGQKLDIERLRLNLEGSGYHCVPQVYEHGEFAVRGSILDIYPMGSESPLRIDLFDDEIESIRRFETETQRSTDKLDSIRLLPAREFPFDEAAIARFRSNWRSSFEGDPKNSLIYRDVSQGLTPKGIEYYFPLFLESTATLFDYLPDNLKVIAYDGELEANEAFWQQVEQRYEQRRHNIERPLLPPADLFLRPDDVRHQLKQWPTVRISDFRQEQGQNFVTRPPLSLPINPRLEQPAKALQDYLEQHSGRILIAAETAGRRESLLDTLRPFAIKPQVVDSWQHFLSSEQRLCITVAPLEAGLESDAVSILTEGQLFAEKVAQSRRRSKVRSRDADSIIHNLTELTVGAPVVHEDQGIGRYLGMQTLDIGGIPTEFLTLEYAGGDKLYVPVASLHLISRYTGTSPENAPLHKLGGEQWQKIKKKAAEKVRDTAAELLEIYARREARQGKATDFDEHAYAQFAASFPFEETPDQQSAIDAVIADLRNLRPMDRVVCGDVGFGKTEVAMRAAFVAAHAGKQVAVLVPTTLLARQHYENFKDRFADWPIRIEQMSRFVGKKEQDAVMKDLADGKVDIVVGTHGLLQKSVKFHNLGLCIIDEEQRFGVKHKEQLKALRAEVDILTLTATPIPRTLNMALSGLRELSIIATPPAQRLAIQTWVGEWDSSLIQEAIQRELKRGGQVYYLHNEVETIEKAARDLEELLPNVRVGIAHGQMREKELEQVMSDFYHQRYHVLVATTIIESGIDVPSANTIIIQRADKLGLAQLHQLRGRVGRSHHRAYAYLLTPPKGVMTQDAIKRLQAIESLEDLGVGFTLATHDLEIRGAGEVLGDEQSGQIQEIGFTLYNELLERAVKALKSGKIPDDELHATGTEIDLRVPSLIPADYMPDVQQRLMMYKRISAARNDNELRELRVELIDRYGLLPDALKTLMEISALKLRTTALGIRKIEVADKGGRLIFDDKPDIDPMKLILLIQSQPVTYQFNGKDTLRFNMDLPDGASRLEAVNDLLNKLTAA